MDAAVISQIEAFALKRAAAFALYFLFQKRAIAA
jgi:hypothetical protein